VADAYFFDPFRIARQAQIAKAPHISNHIIIPSLLLAPDRRPQREMSIRPSPNNGDVRVHRKLRFRVESIRAGLKAPATYLFEFAWSIVANPSYCLAGIDTKHHRVNPSFFMAFLTVFIPTASSAKPDDTKPKQDRIVSSLRDWQVLDVSVTLRVESFGDLNQSPDRALTAAATLRASLSKAPRAL
jgi:hypothetical protein